MQDGSKLIDDIVIRSWGAGREDEAISNRYQLVANVIETIFTLKWLKTGPEALEFVRDGVLEGSVELVNKM